MYYVEDSLRKDLNILYEKNFTVFVSLTEALFNPDLVETKYCSFERQGMPSGVAPPPTFGGEYSNSCPHRTCSRWLDRAAHHRLRSEKTTHIYIVYSRPAHKHEWRDYKPQSAYGYYSDLWKSNGNEKSSHLFRVKLYNGEIVKCNVYTP